MAANGIRVRISAAVAAAAAGVGALTLAGCSSPESKAPILKDVSDVTSVSVPDAGLAAKATDILESGKIKLTATGKLTSGKPVTYDGERLPQSQVDAAISDFNAGRDATALQTGESWESSQFKALYNDNKDTQNQTPDFKNSLLTIKHTYEWEGEDATAQGNTASQANANVRDQIRDAVIAVDPTAAHLNQTIARYNDGINATNTVVNRGNSVSGQLDTATADLDRALDGQHGHLQSYYPNATYVAPRYDSQGNAYYLQADLWRASDNSAYTALDAAENLPVDVRSANTKLAQDGLNGLPDYISPRVAQSGPAGELAQLEDLINGGYGAEDYLTGAELRDMSSAVSLEANTASSTGHSIANSRGPVQSQLDNIVAAATTALQNQAK